MSKYYIYLKNNYIDFQKLLIEKYVFLGLDEIDTIILIKLNNLLNSDNKFSIDTICDTMKVSDEIIKDKLVSLINNQFITLKLVNKSEIYSLDDTYKKLAILLDNEESKEQDIELNKEVSNVVTLLEQEFKKILSPLDLELVSKWIHEDKFTYDNIYDAVLETLKLNKKSIQYVDIILNKNKTKENKVSDDNEIVDLFNKVYGKIK